MRKYDKLFQPNGEFEKLIEESQLVRDIVDKLEETIPKNILSRNSTGMNLLIWSGIESWLEIYLSSAVLHELWKRFNQDKED